jgi:hypothetical protein
MTKIDRLQIGPNSKQNLQYGATILDQIAKHLYQEAGLKCFDDLRVDLGVDDTNGCWLIRACSLDFRDLKP